MPNDLRKAKGELHLRMAKAEQGEKRLELFWEFAFPIKGLSRITRRPLNDRDMSETLFGVDMK